MTDERLKEIFAMNLNRLISNKGISQNELANAIGESSALVNIWTKGKAMPRMGRIQKLADYFGVDKMVLINEPKSEDTYVDGIIVEKIERLNEGNKARLMAYLQALLDTQE